MGCCNCGLLATHQHHIVPRSVGGNDRPSKPAQVCKWCHSLIHDRAFVRHQQLCRQGLQAARQRGQTMGAHNPMVAAANSEKAAAAIAYAKRLVSVVLPMRQRGDSLRTIAGALTASGTATTEGGGTIRWSDNGVKRLLARLVD